MVPAILRRITESPLFHNSILGLILLAAVVVGLETDRDIMARYGSILKTIDWIIIIAFALEAAMKMGAHGKQFYRYFLDPWNVFDFTIVVLCLIPVGETNFAAVLRLARVLRTLRLVSNVPRLQLIVSSLLKGLPSMGYVGVLLLLLFYIYAVMGVFLFRDNDPVHFRDLSNAMITLFRVVTLEDWTDVLYLQMLGSNVYPGYVNTTSVEVIPEAQPITAVIYFVSFVLLGTIIMLNLVIGVILSSMQEAQSERERSQLSAARESQTGLTLADEVEWLEHQIDDFKHHLHLLRSRVRTEAKAARKATPSGDE